MKLLDWLIDLIINRAKRTPYFHLEGYMERYWLIKPNPKRWFFKDFSIRIHRILRSDTDGLFSRSPLGVNVNHFARRILGINALKAITTPKN